VSGVLLRVIGPLEVDGPDGPVSVGGPVPRRILCALLVRPGAVVSVDGLLDAAWGDRPPPSAERSLISHITRLREALARADGSVPALVERRDAGYRLTVAPEDVDATRLEQVLLAVKDVPAAQALPALREAVALWRAPGPFADLQDTAYPAAEAARLIEVFGSAIDALVAAHLDADDPESAAAEAEARLCEMPFRERLWELLIVALYRQGRQADALAAYERARARLADELGVDPGPGLRWLEARVLAQDPGLLAVAAMRRPCPYRGLARYETADAELFVGRERLVDELAARLIDERILVVVGPSGAGKSSLIRAGLVPALAGGVLPGSAAWSVEVIQPGTEPLAVLTAALDRRPEVLVVDQAEEALLADEGSYLASFGDRVLAAADHATRVVLVLRADFYGLLAGHSALARRAGPATVLVGPPDEPELRRIVTEPAARVGLRVDPLLVDLIVADVRDRPGALPVLSTALVRTWEHRDGDLLSVASYRAGGGVEAALQRVGEEAWAALTDDAQRGACRRLLLRLAADEDGSWVRRWARRSELIPPDDPPAAAALAVLTRHRLVVARADDLGIAHEALLTGWPRLHGWLEDGRSRAAVREHLATAAAEWEETGREPGELYRGTRLQAALDTAAASPEDFTPLERVFLTESADEADRQLTEQRARADREARGRRRTRLVAAGLAVALAAAGSAGVYAITKQRQAQRTALTADVSRLATLARTLPNDQRDLALLLGAQGYQLQPSDESVSGLQTALVQTPPGLDRIIRYRSATFLPQLDPAGRLLAVAGADGTVTITDVATGQVVRTLTYPGPRQFAVFSGDANLVAAGGGDGTIAVWDARTGKQSGTPIHVRGSIAWAMFDPTDDTRLYAVTDTRELTTWDRRDPAHPRQIRSYQFGYTGSGDASAITVSPDGQLVAVGDLYGGAVHVLDARTGKLKEVLPGAPGVFGVDGVTLPIASSHRITLYNAVTGRPNRTFNIPSGGLLARLSKDGRRLAIAENASDIAVYDVRSGKIIGRALNLHANAALPVGFLPDGRLVTSGLQEAGIWTIGRTLPPIGRSLPAPGDYDWPIFMPDQPEVVTRGRDHGRLLRHDAATGAALGPLVGGRVGPGFAASPDGRLVVAPAKDHSGVAIWKTATSERLGVLTKVPDDAALAWSPTGHLVATGTPWSVQLWDVHDPARPVRTAIVPNVRGLGIWVVPILTFSRDGTLLQKSAFDENGMTVIDVKSRRVLWSKVLSDVALSQAAISDFLGQTAFSPDGKTLAVDSGDTGKGMVTLYNARTGQPRATIGTQSYGGVDYLHDGQWLVATGGDTKPGAQLFDARTQQPIGVPFPIKHVRGDDYNYGIGYPVAVNDVGTQFAAGELNAPVLWDVDPNHWRTIACTITGRNLSHAEWHTYLPNRHYQRTCPQWPAGN
jgi:WD40 repeat protein/DNA-binding SARP family transcriptional activator